MSLGFRGGMGARVLARACGFSTATLPYGLTRGGNLGFVFDIDGVLLRGSHPLPNARSTLRQLSMARIPFILLTNGGGELEASKAAKLSRLLGIALHPLQVVLSHTPMRPLCVSLAASRVLVLGCRDAAGVARAYGLAHAVTASDLLLDEPSRYPFIDVPVRKPLPNREAPIAAVMVLHDPNSWGLEAQVALDVLRGGWPLGSGRPRAQAVPLYISNPDLTFAGAYPAAPRLAGGAFTVALKALWAATQPGAEPLRAEAFGKPTRATFDFAGARLRQWAAWAAAAGWHARALEGPSELSPAEAAAAAEAEARATADAAALAPGGGAAAGAFERIFMVGDNPAADIAGANAAGGPWRSVLLRTGMWEGGANDDAHPAAHVATGVGEGVAAALAAWRG
jgi:HAD superfamily hydrolase (TIGR01456 family)